MIMEIVLAIFHYYLTFIKINNRENNQLIYQQNYCDIINDCSPSTYEGMNRGFIGINGTIYQCISFRKLPTSNSGIS